MTQADKIARLRLMMDDTEDSDEVLSVYMDLAAHKILNRMYPFRDDIECLEVPDKYVAIQLNISCYMLNKRGAEGEIQHIENGIHRNYGSSEIPDGMLKDIVPFSHAIR